MLLAKREYFVSEMFVNGQICYVASVPQPSILFQNYHPRSSVAAYKTFHRCITATTKAPKGLQRAAYERQDRAGEMEIRAVSGDEEGRKKVERVEVPKTRRPDAVRYIEKKLVDKGIQRMERHPVDGLGIGRGPPKSGHGGKFTWEGPEDVVESELDPVPPAIDEKDPNYVEEDQGNANPSEVVIGEVEVAKVAEAKEGVSRIELLPPLQPSHDDPSAL
ncbi:hypothetical protein BHM03_00002044 [Ensete ventricosum]|nr:hypothetical protein BHM03_00002044 [Ensete ventricosum]